jgi:type I restriction enzyme S subunit
MTQLKSCPVPIPPRQEQVRILARVDELMALLDRWEAKRQERDELAYAFAAAAVHHLDV